LTIVSLPIPALLEWMKVWWFFLSLYSYTLSGSHSWGKLDSLILEFVK
jgi:hypothetical protein